METIAINISELFTERDPKLYIKALKKITNTLKNAGNIQFPSNLTLCLLSKFSESISNIDYPNHKLVCKDFLYFFTIYLKNCPLSTYKDYFISLVSQGLRLSDHLNKVKPIASVDITLLVDYFASIFTVFKGKIKVENATNGEISVEGSIVGATIHSLLQFIDDGVKNPNCFSILNNISESIDRQIAINYYPGICSRLGRFIIKSTNDLTKVYALESLGFWVTKVIDSSRYKLKLKDKINALHNSTDYPVEFAIITKNDTNLVELIINTNSILQSIVRIKSNNPNVIIAFIKFYGQILEKCNHFISKTLHSNIVTYLLSNCKHYNEAAKILQSDNHNIVVSRDVVGRSMANDDFIASIDLFQGYHHLTQSDIIRLDTYVVFNWILKLSEQQFFGINYSDTSSIDKFFKYGREVSSVITNYYKWHLNDAQKYEIVESLSESLITHVIGQNTQSCTSKWLANLNNFRTSSLQIELQPSILIPSIANIGFLIESLDKMPSLNGIVTSFRAFLHIISAKNYLDNEDKLLLCNIYWTLNKCIKHKLQLMDCGIHSLLFDTIHLTCSNTDISSYLLEFMNSFYGDIIPLLSKYSGHLTNTCRAIIVSYDIEKQENNYNLLKAKNVIGFIGKFGLEQGNTALSQLALDILNIPIYLRQSNENSLVKPLISDNSIMECDEEFVITVLTSILLSFQKEISRSRDCRKAIANDLLSRDIKDCVCDDDVAAIPEDILQPLIPIDSLGKFGLYRRVATSVVARARHAMLLIERYNLACKASMVVLLSLYILSTDTSELLPRISEIFPMVLKNINSSIVLSAYAIVILKYCNLVASEFVKHKQNDIVNQIYQRLVRSELAGEADERHLSSRFIFQSFALEYLVIITETKQFCLQTIFQIALLFSQNDAAPKLKELNRKLWVNLKDISPNHVLLLMRCIIDENLASRDILLGEILGNYHHIKIDNLHTEMLVEIESIEPKIALKIFSSFPLKQIPLENLTNGGFVY